MMAEISLAKKVTFLLVCLLVSIVSETFGLGSFRHQSFGRQRSRRRRRCRLHFSFLCHFRSSANVFLDGLSVCLSVLMPASVLKRACMT